jgi:alpha-L-fucosidase
MESQDKKQLYVFSLGLPKPNSTFEVQADIGSKIKRVSVVGSEVDLKWSVLNNKLTFQTPNSSDMDELATVFRVELE